MAVDITAWLKVLGLERYADAFLDNDVDAHVLRTLTADDLKELGVASLGHRKKLLEAIAILQEPADQGAARAAEARPLATPPRDAERRQLTVLFCDLVGSTELSALLDPEDMGAVIRAYHGACAEVVERWGGHVAKYMGDGVLAYFGWPRAHEDEAERAVHAGLELVAKVHALDAPGLAPGGGRAEPQSLAARVGIATGLVMVGELIGAGAAQEQAVIGETPNLAARLQALAGPGTVVIAASTRRLLGSLFALSDLGPVRLKGFAEPLAAFRVEGESGAEGRFEALRGHQLTPLVGRQRELDVLLERWALAKRGDGQAVLLSGEAGIGKSRIIRALREELAGEPHVALSYFSSPSPHQQRVACRDRAARTRRPLLSRGHSGDPTRQTRKTDREGGGGFGRCFALNRSAIGHPGGERYRPLDLSPQRRRQRTLEVLVDLLAGLTRERPVLELYEDVHWPTRRRWNCWIS